MLGWRARIGFISPGNGETTPYEFYRMVPEGVMLVLTCLNIQSLVAEELEEALGLVDQAAGHLARSEVDVIVLGGTPPVVFKGFGADRAIIERIEKATGIPASTKQTVAVEALRTLGVKRVALATPFERELTEKTREFLQRSEFEVVGAQGVGVRRNADIARLPAHTAYTFAKKVFLSAPGAQGIYIPCAQWGPALQIGRLEEDLGVPVVTSTQAMVWWAFRRLHIRARVNGFGRLFETL